MFVFLLILILLAVLGVLGLALKIAAALLLGIMIAVTTVAIVGYVLVRREFRKMQQANSSAISHTTVEIGRPRRDPGPEIDERY